MCWSASVSLNTFVFCSFAVGFAYANGVITVLQAVALFSAIAIQLLEFFIWRDIRGQGRNNALLSKIGGTIILLQPLFFLLTIEHPTIKLVTVLLYSLYSIFMYAFYFSVPGSVDYSTIIGKNKHLQWNWLNPSAIAMIIYLCAIVIPVFFWKQDKHYVILMVGIVSLVISYTLFGSDKTWGSIWCWTVMFISAYLIFLVFQKEVCM